MTWDEVLKIKITFRCDSVSLFICSLDHANVQLKPFVDEYKCNSQRYTSWHG